MQQREELPLAIDFGFFTKGAPLDADGIPDISEDWLDAAQTLAIDIAAKLAVNFLFHPLQRAGFLAGDMLQQHVDLTGSFLLDVA